MKTLSIIFLLLAVILSVIACILPNWSKNEITADIKLSESQTVKGDMSRNDGLWLKCEKYSGSNSKKSNIPMDILDPGWVTSCKSYGSAETPEPDGNIASKILSIVGPVVLLMSALLVGIDYSHSKLIGTAGIWALLSVVFIYPLIVFNHDINDEKSNPICKNPSVTCNYGTLSTSYFLEIGAIVLAIIGLSIHTGKAHKSSKRRK